MKVREGSIKMCFMCCYVAAEAVESDPQSAKLTSDTQMNKKKAVSGHQQCSLSCFNS